MRPGFPKVPSYPPDYGAVEWLCPHVAVRTLGGYTAQDCSVAVDCRACGRWVGYAEHHHT